VRVGETELNFGGIIPGAFGCFMLVVFLFAAVWNCIFMLRSVRGWRRWFVLPSSFLVAVGACGFFSQMISGVGGLDWLPPSFEWPAGHPDDAITTANGTHIDLIKSAGRIQIYDSRWHFLRGWPVQSVLRIRFLGDGSVEALTKHQKGLVFDINGRLLSRRVYEVHESVHLLDSLPPCENVFVPTSPWLYIFSSPFVSWIVLMGGLAGWFVASRLMTFAKMLAQF
jgi:hypothetical protein